MSKLPSPKPARNKYVRPGTERRWIRIAGTAGVLLGILLIAAVVYFEGFAPEVLEQDASVVSPADEAAPPDAADPHEMDPEEAARGIEVVPGDLPPEESLKGPFPGVIAPGDTAGVLLQEWLGATEIHKMVEACKDVYSLAKIRAGQPFVVQCEDDGTLCRFEYEIDNDQRLVVVRDAKDGAGTWAAQLEEIEYDVRLEKIEGSISSSLFESMTAVGESPALAVRLAEVFAWEINFIRDIRVDDSFRVLVEKRYRDGEFKGYGKMPLAEFTNQGRKFEGFLFTDSFGNPTYFTAKGESLKRAFLKAPLSFTRISSRFNLQRKHPIFKTVRPHPAVDYAAPSGTPVKAIGSGVVHFRGWGKGAGNYIVLKHANGYESMYMHLKGFARGLKKGQKVRQGELIGYVGSTGYSTGPHLDFRMKQNGKFLNPEKVLSPRDESVPKKSLEAFHKEREGWLQYMDGTLALGDYGKTAPAAETADAPAVPVAPGAPVAPVVP